jgi:outer membrane receptor for ferrienterochelin and colicin
MVSQFGKLTGVLTHNNGVGDLDYKLSTGWDRLSGWTDEDNDTGENRRFNGRLWYSIDDKSTFRLLGRIQDLRGDVTMLSGLDPTRHDTMVYHMKTDYSRPNTKYHASWRRIAGKTRYEEPTLYYTESDAFDIDLQHSFHPLDSNLITWGLSYRFNRMDSDILDTLHSQNLWAGYIQDQIRLSKALSLTAGLRYDRHPLTGNNLSPRGSIVYSPARGHALRASTGRAFQNPSFLDSYLSMIYKMTILPFPVPIDIETRGNRDLSPEWITSFELGYQGTFGTRLRGRVDLFLNNLDGLIGFEMVDTYDENALFPGSPGGIIPAATSLFNGHDADATGGEVDAEFLVTRWLSAHGNYSYQRVTDSDTGERIESAPRHKMNAGLCAKLGQGLLISLFANHVDKTAWDNIEIDPYTMLNSAVSYRTRDERMQIALSVTTLLNDKHKEHPQGDEICRSVVLSLTIQ